MRAGLPALGRRYRRAAAKRRCEDKFESDPSAIHKRASPALNASMLARRFSRNNGRAPRRQNHRGAETERTKKPGAGSAPGFGSGCSLRNSWGFPPQRSPAQQPTIPLRESAASGEPPAASPDAEAIGAGRRFIASRPFWRDASDAASSLCASWLSPRSCASSTSDAASSICASWPSPRFCASRSFSSSS